MIPHDEFTPHGYLDNPFHSWKLNPSGVLRSLPPLGMGWHVPNLGSYARNQFQYTAHMQIGLKIGKTLLMTPTDFKRAGCQLVSHLHTKNRFEYTGIIPKYELSLTARYFLIEEHALGCILTLATTAQQPQTVTCYLMHQHTHNPHTSRLWEHGLYAIKGPEEGTCLLGLASEGDAFVHGARSADGGALTFGEMGYVVALEDAAIWASGAAVPPPNITVYDEHTGWQTRTVILPCQLTLTKGSERVINVVLARGVSQDQASRRWLDGIEEIARVEAGQREEDEQFWKLAPQLSGDWPAHWRRGLVYDLETLRMVMRPSVGILDTYWDGMQIQAPRLVLAEAAMDALFLSYANPELAAEAILGYFEAAPHPQLPCMREDGSYNMIADDGQICGTAPEWGYPVWCCDSLWRRTGDLQWLRRLYPRVAAYIRWWLENRRDAEGWLIYACSWESGQDVSSRFGPQQTGGSIIQHIRPVDLQASMAQGARILAQWAHALANAPTETADGLPAGAEPAHDSAGVGFSITPVSFEKEAELWQDVANEFTIKTRLMWQEGWFRDYDAVAQEWSSQQDTMHLSPVFCGAAGWGHSEQLRPYFAKPPVHSGWAPLSWPPVVMTLVGAAAAAEMPLEAAELAYQFIDASYRSIDSPDLDEHGGLPGVTREYRGTVTVGKWGELAYVNAGIEGYGWGAISVHLVLRYLLGLCEEQAGTITMMPALPPALRRAGASYRAEPLPWGNYVLALTCTVRDAQNYHMRLRCAERARTEIAEIEGEERFISVQETEWDGTWGDKRTFQLPHLT